MCPPHLLPGADELRAGVACQHGEDDHLPPLLHVHQQVAQLPVVLVDEVDAIGAHFLERHHHAAGHQLRDKRRKAADESDLLFPVVTVQTI